MFKSQPPPRFILYYELVLTSKEFARQVMEIKKVHLPPPPLPSCLAPFVDPPVPAADRLAPPAFRRRSQEWLLEAASHYFSAQDLDEFAKDSRKMPNQKAISRGAGAA